MRIGVLGTGMVGEAIATRLIELNHEVMLGSRSPDNPKAAAWADHHAPHACTGTFEEAAAYGSFVFHCTNGATAEGLLGDIAGVLAGKVVIDTSNPLDFSGDAPGLFVAITDSLGERLQRAAPEARLVKALNTINASVMVHPEQVPGEHVTFMAGDDDAAKAAASELLQQFGWRASQIIDIGDLKGARATEAYLPLWLKLMGHAGSPQFNITVSAAG